jgi:glycosyltransferase involved in cell wall biosynthesis
MIKKLSIIIPVYNEEATILELLQRVIDVQLVNNIEKEIIIVNDASMDKSDELINDFLKSNTDIVYLKHTENKGKGAAIKTALEKVTGEYVIIQDADLEYNPNEYNDLLEPIIFANADVVYGSRFIGGNPHRILFFWHSIGNKFITFLSNMFTNLNLTDIEVCYKLIRTDIIRKFDIKEKGFGIEPELTAKLSKVKKIKIYEVGISYYGRTYAEGKKINWKDGFKALYCIVKYNF